MPPAAGDALGRELFVAFAMWTVMMAAMMLPTVAPWLLAMRRLAVPPRVLSTAQFLAGYLTAWTLFSAVAAAAQWWLYHVAFGSRIGAASTPLLGGGLLVVAGLFQLTSVKDTCLRHCQSPLGFFLVSWRGGRWGALRMGVHHGLYCVGCCWALMALAFVTGVMSVVWMVGVTVFIFVDQAILRTAVLTRCAGVALLLAGIWTLVAA